MADLVSGYGTWRKSSRSGNTTDNCVEVAGAPAAVGVRDSKDRSGPVLAVVPGAWAAFVAEVRSGRLDG
ncbi:DUF397 domain-containing protein [Actinocatenispora rupis]|uniref:DUF397 domain-containing protein n=1 Tax=Actinocatenispora rupis TaxID=519421 RepID=A0A8J3J512_9ACTN|nr:DUF397 domain-containing protein [Actinocatenispora rupis]GID12092.1 hypothetical protein Aru02nite_29810 [Actinocatenispora rupis]